MPEVGGGDVMRCISIGRELSVYESVHFLLCKGGEYWIERIRYYGMTASIYTSPAEVNGKNLLVDGYNFSNSEIQKWSDQCDNMTFIDDNNMAPKNIDLVISTCMDNCKKKGSGVLLYGPKYALLAAEYAKKHHVKNKTIVNKILISCGLQDSKNYVNKILKALSKINYCGNVIIAIGRKSPNLQELLHSISSYNFPINTILDSNGLYDLLIEVDMVIGTGGVSLLERMAIGIPSITIISSENQRKQTEWSEGIGATILVDPVQKKFKYNLVRAIYFLLKSKEKRLDIINIGVSTIDGKGSERVAKKMATLN